ncbi:hypothetical protein VTN77DRAFT_3491 [Rasamsonia byssochlamydoides]|uniref:uncharacterized protein n=1 Tax=Rasamsonia byssochlamydoides TaxID=89139 RepID=UPI003743336C
MSAPSATKIFVIGGTGAQGLPVVRGLVSDGKYSCRILTRDSNSPRAKGLLALGNIELFEGSFMNEEDLRRGYRGCDGAYINIDGFNCGEKTETFWAMRAYELAIEDGGIRFFVYGNLDYVYRKSGYNPIFRTGHYDGKGRVGEWVLAQHASNRELYSDRYKMGVALFTLGPYIEMTISRGSPMTPSVEEDEDGEKALTWRVPLGAEGAVVHVALDDCAHYVRWLFENPSRANGMNLEVAVEHIKYAELAKAFERVTGHRARFIDVDMDTYWRTGPMSAYADNLAGYGADRNDPATMTVKQNFTGFWNMWRHSGNNRGIIQRNYALLDEIHPHRIRSAEEFLRKQNESGLKAGKGSLWERVQPEKIAPVLKNHEDGRRAS